MANEWEWRDVGFTTKEQHFVAEKGFCTVAALLDTETNLWSISASISSPDEDEIEGVQLSCNKTFSTKEQAQDAAVKLLKKFVKKIYTTVMS